MGPYPCQISRGTSREPAPFWYSFPPSASSRIQPSPAIRLQATESSSFCVSPILSDSHVYDKRDIQALNVLHFSFDHLCDALGLFRRSLEQQLIMYLQQHPGAQITARKLMVDLDHRHLDEIGR